MSYTHLEKTILLGLKARWKESVMEGTAITSPAAGSLEEFWQAVDDVYRCWDDVIHSEEKERIVKKRLLDVVGCSEADLRAALSILLREDPYLLLRRRCMGPQEEERKRRT